MNATRQVIHHTIHLFINPRLLLPQLSARLLHHHHPPVYPSSKVHHIYLKQNHLFYLLPNHHLNLLRLNLPLNQLHPHQSQLLCRQLNLRRSLFFRQNQCKNNHHQSKLSDRLRFHQLQAVALNIQ